MDPQVTENVSLMTDDMMKTALTEFQMFVGLEPTGKMDEATHQIMNKSRCGVKDKHDFDRVDGRRKRFTIFGGPWPKSNITYTVRRYPSSKLLQIPAVDEELEKALTTWADVAKLNFLSVPSDKSADITVEFHSRDHGDGYPFDGKGMVLAHSSAPPSGNVHFDDDEEWTIRKYEGENMFHVALHEFGHALGLDHSNVTDSVMFPYVEVYNPDIALHSDDIQGIQALYGPRTHFPPDLCSNSTFDAIFQYPAGVIYILKGEYYWKLAADGPLSGYPKLIASRWHGLPGNVDAAAAHPMGRIYFFKGDKTWAYIGSSLLPDYPKLISDDWKGIPNNVDAAMCYKMSTFFFFKGYKYWKYNMNRHRSVDVKRYPKPLSKWGNISGGLDDVLRIGNFVYFFRKGRYYRFNCITHLVDEGHADQVHNHRAAGPWLFRCRDNDTDEYDGKNLIKKGLLNLGIRKTNTSCPVLTMLSAAFLILLTLSF
jgi:matrix metalloproteinase-14 (membrane-inserted)